MDAARALARGDLPLARAPAGKRIPVPHESSAMPTPRTARSRETTYGLNRTPNRCMLRAVGFHDDDFDKPMIGVASLWSDITPCNAHLDRLMRKVYEGVRAAAGVPQGYGAPTATDGIMMGHSGM